MLVLCNVSLGVMSGVRALSNAEGARSRALAYAVRDLEQYAQMRDDDAYERFLADIAAATALRDARVELEGSQPDLTLATRRLTAARVQRTTSTVSATCIDGSGVSA